MSCAFTRELCFTIPRARARSIQRGLTFWNIFRWFFLLFSLPKTRIYNIIAMKNDCVRARARVYVYARVYTRGGLLYEPPLAATCVASLCSSFGTRLLSSVQLRFPLFAVVPRSAMIVRDLSSTILFLFSCALLLLLLLYIRRILCENTHCIITRREGRAQE